MLDYRRRTGDRWRLPGGTFSDRIVRWPGRGRLESAASGSSRIPSGLSLLSSRQAISNHQILSETVIILVVLRDLNAYNKLMWIWHRCKPTCAMMEASSTARSGVTGNRALTISSFIWYARSRRSFSVSVRHMFLKYSLDGHNPYILREEDKNYKT